MRTVPSVPPFSTSSSRHHQRCRFPPPPPPPPRGCLRRLRQRGKPRPGRDPDPRFAAKRSADRTSDRWGPSPVTGGGRPEGLFACWNLCGCFGVRLVFVMVSWVDSLEGSGAGIRTGAEQSKAEQSRARKGTNESERRHGGEGGMTNESETIKNENDGVGMDAGEVSPTATY